MRVLLRKANSADAVHYSVAIPATIGRLGPVLVAQAIALDAMP